MAKNINTKKVENQLIELDELSLSLFKIICADNLSSSKLMKLMEAQTLIKQVLDSK